MHLWQLALYAGISLVMSVVSGIAGGGGGFVMTPLLILFGLTPAQAVSTGKISGISITMGSLGGFGSEHGQLTKRRVIPVMVLALMVGLLVPFVIRGLDSSVYRIAMGVLLLVMIPILMIKKIGLKRHKPTLAKKLAGGGLLTLALFLQGVFSGGMGTLVNVVLMGMLGMTATEANITKRWSQVILNVTVLAGVMCSNLVVWQISAVSVPTTLVGGFIGGKLAVKRGNQFVLNVMILLMLASALALIFGVRG